MRDATEQNDSAGDRVSTAKTRSPLVVFVILNWNQCQLTLDCLASLAQQDYARFKIVLVDNGSTDGSQETIRRAYPEITLIENKENLGYSEGNNVGIQVALELRADYVFLLNNDTVVDPAMLSTLLDCSESDPRIGMVSPNIYYYDEPQRIWCAGAMVDWRNGAIRRLKAGQQDEEVALTPKDVDALSGCALCIKRKVVEEIGLMDPAFFIYYDEIEWAVRARKAGYRVVHVPAAKMWHKVSAAMKQDSPSTAYYMNRNVLLFLRKSLSPVACTVALSCQVSRQIRTILALTLRTKYRSRQQERNARVLALLDFAAGRFGRRNL